MTRGATVCVLFLIGAGCGAKQDAQPQAEERPRIGEKPEMSTAWRSTPLAVYAQPTAVKEGAAPLVYMVEGGSMIRVHDLTDQRDLARSHVPARTIVRVDGRRGVIYGDAVVFGGPLPAEHRYVIFVDSVGENVARQGVVQPRPRGAR
jgi:hypothetical protein